MKIMITLPDNDDDDDDVTVIMGYGQGGMSFPLCC